MNFKIDSMLTVAATALLVGTLIVGCQDTGYPDPQPATAAPLRSSTVRAVNVTDAASSLAVLLENEPIANALGLGQTSPAVQVPFLGSLQIRVRNTGGTLGTTDISTKTTVLPNITYTAFVTDSINRPRVVNAASGLVTDVGGSRLLVVSNPTTQTLAAGNGAVRFGHFVQDLGLPASTTVTITPAASYRLSSISSTTATTVSLTNLPYRTVATTYIPVAAGTYRVDKFSGSTISATATPVASSTMTVEAAKFYTVYSQGLTRRRNIQIGTIQHN
jgi:hypothetical protein